MRRQASKTTGDGVPGNSCPCCLKPATLKSATLTMMIVKNILPPLGNTAPNFVCALENVQYYYIQFKKFHPCLFYSC